MSFILRVDDVGQSCEQDKPDVKLEYFREWWDAGGWGEHPIYLGVVPAALGDWELDYLHQLERDTKAVLCIHGWDHKNRILTPEDIALAADRLPNARHVIPPYNRYDRATISATGRLGERSTLFGGFEVDHRYGHRPTVVDGVLHLSACESLYMRCYQLCGVIPFISSAYDYPRVITMHHRWDAKTMTGVGQLRALLGSNIIDTEAAWPVAAT